jgi:hypothetical protein
MTSIRHFMQIVESAGRESDPFAFADHMIDACSRVGVGFHFEEGGCWGMALALHDHFTSLGIPSWPVIGTTRGRDSHAMVEADGRLYDHQGITRWKDTTDRVDRDELLHRAERAGFSEGEVESDRAQAAEIIEFAVEMGQGLTESAGRESVALTEGRDARLYHATSVDSLYEILDANAITANTGHPITHTGGEKRSQHWSVRPADVTTNGYLKGVSLTRSLAFAQQWKSRSWTSQHGVVLVLDGALIKRDFRIMPVSFWGNSMRHEAEEFVVGAIKPVSRYLIEVEATAEVIEQTNLADNLKFFEFPVRLSARPS